MAGAPDNTINMRLGAGGSEKVLGMGFHTAQALMSAPAPSASARSIKLHNNAEMMIQA